MPFEMCRRHATKRFEREHSVCKVCHQEVVDELAAVTKLVTKQAEVVTEPVTKLATVTKLVTKPKGGRPRKYANQAERQAAYRKRK